MKIMVDTSVWVEYFRGRLEESEQILENGLHAGTVVTTGPVVSELLQGCKSDKEQAMLAQCLDAIPFIECTWDDWISAGKVSYTLRKGGVTVPLTDTLIAVVSKRIGASLFTFDRHFQAFSELTLLTTPK